MNTIKDLTITTIESFTEQYFASKCKNLLTFYSKDTLINYASDPNMFSSIFANSILPEKEIHFILLKRYYLSKPKSRENSETIQELLNEKDFDTLESLIEDDKDTRITLMANYLDNLTISNNQLTNNKLCTESYSNIDDVITTMRSFYETQVYGDNPQLLKSYK